MKITQLLLIALLIVLSVNGISQTEITYQTALVPPGMLGAGKYISMEASTDGKFMMAASIKEVRCWKLPEGTLIYRFQAGRERNGDRYVINKEQMNCTTVNEFSFINNGKYLRVKGMRCGNEFIEIADLPNGELYKSGSIFETNKAIPPDSYFYTLSRQKMEQMSYYPSTLSSPVIKSKDCYVKDAHDIFIYSAVADPLQPGRNLILFSEGVQCMEEWYKKILPKDEYKMWQSWGKPTPYKFYLASVSTDGRDVKRLSQIDPGFWYSGSARYYSGDLAPNGDNIIIKNLSGSSYATTQIKAYDRTGKFLWQLPRANVEYSFLSFAEYNNVWFVEEANQEKFYVLYDILTGKVLERMPFPKDIPSHKFIPQWDMMAVARTSEAVENSSVITLHNVKNGGLVSVLTDPESVTSFSTIYFKEQERIAKENEERRIQQEKWAAQQHEWQARNWELQKQRDLVQSKLDAEKALKEGEQKARAQAAYDLVWMSCPRCNGTGGKKESITTYSGGARTVYDGFGGKTVFQDKSNPLYTEQKFVLCTLCWGKAKVKR